MACERFRERARCEPSKARFPLSLGASARRWPGAFPRRASLARARARARAAVTIDRGRNVRNSCGKTSPQIAQERGQEHSPGCSEGQENSAALRHCGSPGFSPAQHTVL
eukprot:7050965-Prymnesium_polylepis.1